MRDKVKELVYLDTGRYISMRDLSVFYWGILIVPLMEIVFGMVAIKYIGVTWKSLFPFVSMGIWSLLYGAFVLLIRSKAIKKTFALRFLVNGLMGVFISSLFWILYATLSLYGNNHSGGFDFPLWMGLFYVLFSALYMGLIVLGVHKGIFRKIKKKSRTPTALAVSALFNAILPGAGVMGMYTSRILRAHASDAVQNIATTFAFVLMFFLPLAGHINFVQYFYSKKYRILCDENGNTTSPDLEYHRRKKTGKTAKTAGQPDGRNGKSSKKNRPLFIKILIVILSVPMALFFMVFLVFCVKDIVGGWFFQTGIVKGISYM